MRVTYSMLLREYEPRLDLSHDDEEMIDVVAFRAPAAAGALAGPHPPRAQLIRTGMIAWSRDHQLTRSPPPAAGLGGSFCHAAASRVVIGHCRRRTQGQPRPARVVQARAAQGQRCGSPPRLPAARLHGSIPRCASEVIRTAPVLPRPCGPAAARSYGRRMARRRYRRVRGTCLMDWLLPVTPNQLGSEDTEARRYPRAFMCAGPGSVLGPPAGTPSTVSSPWTADAVPAGRGRCKDRQLTLTHNTGGLTLCPVTGWIN
jgi:hypothetical protein